jgi:concentrative nucleoside transporter, CNT family
MSGVERNRGDRAESAEAAALMGTKTVLNEFVAYVDFAKLPNGTLRPQTRLIVASALRGFANFGSLGILVGGMGEMVPERRREITELGLRSILSGNDRHLHDRRRRRAPVLNAAAPL